MSVSNKAAGVKCWRLLYVCVCMCEWQCMFMCKTSFAGNECMYCKRVSECVCVPPSMPCHRRFVGCVVMCPVASLLSVHWLHPFSHHPQFPSPLSHFPLILSTRVPSSLLYIPFIHTHNIMNYSLTPSLTSLVNRVTALHDHCSALSPWRCICKVWEHSGGTSHPRRLSSLLRIDNGGLGGGQGSATEA